MSPAASGVGQSADASSEWLLNLLLGSFEDPRTEYAFRTSTLISDARSSAALMLGLSAILLSGVALDVQRVDGDELAQLFVARGIITIAGVLGALLVLFRPGIRKLQLALLLFFPLIVAAYAFIAYHHQLAVGSTNSPTVIPAISIFCYALSSSNVATSIVSAAITLFIAVLLHTVFLDSNAAQLATIIGVGLPFSIMGYLYLRANRLQRRRSFMNAELLTQESLRLEQANQKLQDYKDRLQLQMDEQNDQLKETRHSLAVAQRMETIGQLAGGIAHDFNNLLTIILSYADLFEREPDHERRPAYIEKIRKAALRSADMTGQLLSFSRRQVMDLKTTDLVGLVQDTQGIVESIIPKNIDVEVSVPDEPMQVLADYGQLEQAIINLVINARDAMPNGGSLLIDVSRQHWSQEQLRGKEWVSPGEFICVRVSDNGTGIEAELLDRIFDPFFTTKQVGQGSGLGLSMVMGTVRQLGGFIGVETESGQGTAVSLCLPLQTVEAEDNPTQDKSEILSGSGTILLVEDEEEIREVVVLILEGAGYEVLLADSSEAGLEVYDQHTNEIDLALLDVVMPGMNGGELMKELRDRGYSRPVLFMSGYSDTGIHTDFILAEGLELLTKPFMREDLLGRITGLLQTQA